MTFLAADIGNSKVSLGLFKGRRLLGMWKLETRVNRTADEWAEVVSRLLGRRAKAVRASAISSVVPSMTGPLRSALAAVIGGKLVVLDHRSPFGFLSAYRPPADAGVDPLANAAAAIELCGYPVIAVDVGTAVTIDVVSCRGVYLGGCIFPGLRLAAETLARGTASMPLETLEGPVRAVGGSTSEGIRAGIVLGCAAQIDGLLERIFMELRERPPVVVTGGSALAIVPHCRHARRFEPFLTLEGVRLAGTRTIKRGKR